MSDWKLPWEGRCRCGEVQVRVTQPPMLACACHCTGCQRMAASAFSLTLTIPTEGFAVTKGEPVLGGANKDQHHFCPSCLTWMFTRAEGMDWFVNLRPTMLDAHDWFVPFAEFWTSEKLPWATTPAERSYERVPDLEEFEPLMAAFAEKGARPG